ATAKNRCGCEGREREDQERVERRRLTGVLAGLPSARRALRQHAPNLVRFFLLTFFLCFRRRCVLLRLALEQNLHSTIERARFIRHAEIERATLPERDGLDARARDACIHEQSLDGF